MKNPFKKEISIIEALSLKPLLGQFLKDPETWRAWFTVLKAFFALDYDKEDLALYQQCTGREKWPRKALKELWLMIGVRGGKSFIIAILAAYLAVFKRYALSAGEKGYILIVAPTVKQGSIIKSYLSSIFNENDFFRPYIARENQTELELSNGIVIAILASDYKTLRGYTAVACIVDEVAYLEIEGQKPDVEIIRALRSRLLNTKGPLIAISSPYAKRGQLYETWKRHFGKDDSHIMVWQAGSATMNPTLDLEAIKQAKAEDPEGSRADYDAEFRNDIESYISREAVEAVMIPGRYELPYNSNYGYFAFVDPSGGSKDSMTLAIGHTENEIRVLDCLREKKPPFSPENVVEQFAETLKEYHVHTVTGDRYGGQWPQERFSVHGINYQVSDKAKSDIYAELLAPINSGRVELLDNEKLINQLVNLERRTARSGKDSIDHSPGGHDDLVNAAAGCLVGLASGAAAVGFIAGGARSQIVGMGDNRMEYDLEGDYVDLRYQKFY